MNKRALTIARSVGLIGATVAIMVSATFASLTSTATLSANTITTATANLLVSTDGVNFGSSKPGFAFTGVVPGGSPSANKSFSLKNDQADNNLGLSVLATTPASEPNITDNNLVHVKFTNTVTTLVSTYTLAQLISGAQPFDATLNANTTMTYIVSVSMDAGAVSGSSSGSVSAFDLSFTGTSL